MALFVLFVLVPALEMVVLIEVGSRVGPMWTLGLIFLTAAVGAVLAKNEGLAVLERIRDDVAMGRVPTNALVEGFLILAAGLFLMTPGFLTDTLGFLILFPLTRPFFRELAKRWLRHRIELRGPRDPRGPRDRGQGGPDDWS